MKASVTNFVQTARIDISEEQFERLSRGDNPETVLEREQWAAIRSKIPRSPASDLTISRVDPDTGRSASLIWYRGMNSKPRFRQRNYCSKQAEYTENN